MNKNEKKSLKSLQSITSNLEKIKKNASYPKESYNLKMKSISSNQIYTLDEGKDDKISKPSLNNTNYKKTKKKGKEKNNHPRHKKKDKMINLLKLNEQLKIPTGKRRSLANNNTKFILNEVNNIYKSLTPPKKTNIRTDKNGIEINKSNKKKVHITFLDDISPNNKITDTVNIQSYKQFNVIKNFSSLDNNNKNKCGQCCLIY